METQLENKITHIKMGKTLEEKMHEIELALSDIKADVKIIRAEISNYKGMETRVRLLEDYKNKLAGMAIIAGVLAGFVSSVVTTVIVKLIMG